MCAWLVKMVMKLTLNGRSVPARTAAMVFDNASAGISPTPIEPSAPALLTATARLGVMPTNAMPACAIGVASPYASVNRVCSVMGQRCQVRGETGLPVAHHRVCNSCNGEAVRNLSTPKTIKVPTWPEASLIMACHVVSERLRRSGDLGGSHGSDAAAALVHAGRG